jgi:hypothetical protein
MKATIQHFEVIGSSRRCLIINIEGLPTFCSTSNYAYLCMHPDTRWDVIERAAHEDPRTGKYFIETRWLQVYKPTLF